MRYCDDCSTKVVNTPMGGVVKLCDECWERTFGGGNMTTDKKPHVLRAAAGIFGAMFLVAGLVLSLMIQIWGWQMTEGEKLVAFWPQCVLVLVLIFGSMPLLKAWFDSKT